MSFSAVSTIWVLIATVLVFFMQAGFAMVETGFTRAKNAGNIIMKNLMDFCIGTLIFWIFGFGLMFGVDNGFVGIIDFFTVGNYDSILPSGISKYSFIMFQTVFCATAATIVSGAMAERTKFSSYIIYSALISAFVYPISGHWIWGGGWLANLGFNDFAGSTAVHMVGGVAALLGAKILGPRIGKFDKKGKAHAIPGHSLTLGALGVFILWFCWFGFNGGSTLSMENGSIESAGHIFMTTNLAAAISTFTVMVITWIKYKKPDVSMTLNGALAGLVAITAGCNAVSPIGAFFIGLIAGLVVVFGIGFIEKVLKIDDPVGAIGVHGLCGALGTILVGLFSVEKGLFYGNGFSFLGIQVLGVLSVGAWVLVTMSIAFLLIKKTVGLRASKEEEIKGLDIAEHGLLNAYADFTPMVESMYEDIEVIQGVIPLDEAVPVQLKTSKTEVVENKKLKLTKVEILFNQNKFEALKTAMHAIGITGMTVTYVLGCGIQNGKTEFYRGVEVDMQLLPKVQVEIVVAKVPVKRVIETAKKILYTGNIGDGKIFVYDVENVIKVRTGEEGYDALQDVE